MQKTFFPLTRFLLKDEKYGEIWKKIYDEHELAKKYLQKITGTSDLMSDFPVEQESVQMREKIILPLTTIQQFALANLRDKKSANLQKSYEKLVIRCSFGIINAGRNSA